MVYALWACGACAKSWDFQERLECLVMNASTSRTRGRPQIGARGLTLPPPLEQAAVNSLQKTINNIMLGEADSQVLLGAVIDGHVGMESGIWSSCATHGHTARPLDAC